MCVWGGDIKRSGEWGTVILGREFKVGRWEGGGGNIKLDRGCGCGGAVILGRQFKCVHGWGGGG